MNVHQPIAMSGVEVRAATELSVGKRPIPAHSSSAVDIQASPSRSLEPSPTGNSWGQDNPFYSPEDPWRSPQYGAPPADDTASSLVGQSSSAAISLYGDDDGTQLTSREEDPVARRRRTLRYSTSPSQLRKMGTAIQHVSQNLHRASVRVVNMASVGLERLSDDDDHLPDLAQTLPEPIRGRTLVSWARKADYGFYASTFSLHAPSHSTTQQLLYAVLPCLGRLRGFCSLHCLHPRGLRAYMCLRLFFDPDTTSSFALRKSLALPTGEKGLVGRTPPETIELPFRLGISRSATQTTPQFAIPPPLLDPHRRARHLRLLGLLRTCVPRPRAARLLAHPGLPRPLQPCALRAFSPSPPEPPPSSSRSRSRSPSSRVVTYLTRSLRRTCVLESMLGEQPIVLNDQFCGGYVDPGYICPLGQTCRESGTNPLDGVESFDTIYFSALQVIIVASANGWSPLMYATIDSEYFVSCIFFILCVVVLNFWLINLFVAVITNTFSAIRAETRKSAFGATKYVFAEHDDDRCAPSDGRPSPPRHINPAALIVRHPNA
ncbi:hypothetical protein B0H14DRAFT_3886546 [Mycena olivaceomarginata]|nr:hypothetical protein B0H14DRAFT_3886546 [Mycena olivaceomarginata]